MVFFENNLLHRNKKFPSCFKYYGCCCCWHDVAAAFEAAAVGFQGSDGVSWNKASTPKEKSLRCYCTTTTTLECSSHAGWLKAPSRSPLPPPSTALSISRGATSIATVRNKCNVRESWGRVLATWGSFFVKSLMTKWL